MEKPKCCERVPEGGRSVSFRGCRQYGTIQRDGKWYCAIHDPVAVAEKRHIQDAKWEAEREVLRQQRADSEYNRLAGIYCRAKGMTLEQLKALEAETDTP